MSEPSAKSNADAYSDEKRTLSDDNGVATYQTSDSSSELGFGGEASLPPPPTLTEEQEKRLYRKIDKRLMPILSLMYLGAFLDRGRSNPLLHYQHVLAHIYHEN